MASRIRKAGVAAALAVAGLLGTGAGSALASTSLGPYPQQSSCLRAGNDGQQAGEWPDFDCTEDAPEAWYIHPIWN